MLVNCKMNNDDYEVGTNTVTNIHRPTNWIGALGETIDITVVAYGDNLTYQWFYRPVGKINWIATTDYDNSYDINMANARNGREMFCRITCGGYSVETDVETMSISG